MAYVISEEKRSEYRQLSTDSRERKKAALADFQLERNHKINIPRLDPSDLMPRCSANGLRVLSLFSGGGGLDLGFDLAGFEHVASYEWLDVCGMTLRENRPNWNVFGGAEGDVRGVDWSQYKGKVDVVQGGPPCQPFSIAGKQKGAEDERNMWPSFIKAVHEVKPRFFLAENVTGLLDPKFADFLSQEVLEPLSDYHIRRFIVNATGFGIPQIRRRVIFVGFAEKRDFDRYEPPTATFIAAETSGLFEKRCPGVRESLGLDNIGYDTFAPTLRSGFTGPRNTTGVVNSQASMRVWDKLQIWPNGVQPSRELASAFPVKNGHFRMSVQDCAVIQGFPADWHFAGAVYQVLGQIGNSVCPPVAYNLARSIAEVI